MRIGMVTPYAWNVPGGVNDHVLNLTRELEAKGHEVWVLAPWGRPGGGAEVPMPRRFVWMGSAIGVRTNGSRAHISTWPFMLSRMEATLRELQVDVLHVHEPCVPAVAAAAVLRARSAVVGTFHAALERSLWCQAMFPLARRIVAGLDARIAVSPAASRYPGARFPGEFRIIPNGVRLASFCAETPPRKQPGSIAFVGRPEPRKGLGVLLQAFAEVREALPHATLRLVGPTPAQAIARLPGSRGQAALPAGVTALGRVDQATKAAELGAAEVLCAPSLGGESFGIVLLEGMASRAAVVASDLPGYRGVLDGGRCGLLVEPGDSEALASALLSVLGGHRLRSALVEAHAVGRR